MASPAPGSAAVLVSPVVADLVAPVPIAALAEGVEAPEENVEELAETSVYPSMDELEVSQSGSENEEPMEDVKIDQYVGVSAQGALVRSRFMNISQINAILLFFFGLDKKNGQRKIIHSLRTGSCSEISDSAEIRKYAAGF